MRWLAPVCSLVLLCGCIKQMAVNMIGDALSASGTTFSSDEDPELIAHAVPFGLKTYESLLEAAPEHRGLLFAAASGFTQYGYAFVQQEADRVDDADLARARELRERARKLYLRGRDYALRGLELEHPGITERLKAGRQEAIADVTKDDVRFLYWGGVSWAAALMVNKSDVGLIADLPMAAAMVERVIQLDPTYNEGAAQEFFISYDGARSEAMGGSRERARKHYARALELSGGNRASVHLALAESVCIAEQNIAEFRDLLERALAVDPDRVVGLRLSNILARRRALWLKSRIADLFVEGDKR